MLAADGSEEYESFPTIPMAENDEELRYGLAQRLRHDGYLVLEAEDMPGVLSVALVHSRPIHLLLMDPSMESRTLAATLEKYRPEMRVWFVKRHPHESRQDALPLETVLERVQVFFQSKNGAAER
jgi:hypothetical protein